jgi:formylglycine-generating enzyme required for sulfatase activity
MAEGGNASTYAVFNTALALVGTKTANSLGLFDMSGNAAEYTWNFSDRSIIARGGFYRQSASGVSILSKADVFYSSEANYPGSFGLRLFRNR